MKKYSHLLLLIASSRKLPAPYEYDPIDSTLEKIVSIHEHREILRHLQTIYCYMYHWAKPVYCIIHACYVSPYVQQIYDLQGDPILYRTWSCETINACWSSNNSQPWVDLETRFTHLACFLFCKVKVILDLWFRGNLTNDSLPLR